MKRIYIDRDVNGDIIASYARPQNNDHEYILEDSAEWQAHIQEKQKKKDIIDVKQRANDDILDLFPDWKQRNMLAEGLLDLIELLKEKNVFTQTELEARPKAAELLSAWDQVVARRKQSDQEEAAIK